MSRPLTTYDPDAESKELNQRAEALFPGITAVLISAFARLPIGNAKLEVGKSHSIMLRPSHDRPFRRLEATYRFLTLNVFADPNLSPQESSVVTEILDYLCRVTGFAPLHRLLKVLWTTQSEVQALPTGSNGLDLKLEATSDRVVRLLNRFGDHANIQTFLRTTVQYYQICYNFDAAHRHTRLLPYIFGVLQVLYTMVPLEVPETRGESAWTRAEAADDQGGYAGEDEYETAFPPLSRAAGPASVLHREKHL